MSQPARATQYTALLYSATLQRYSNLRAKAITLISLTFQMSITSTTKDELVVVKGGLLSLDMRRIGELKWISNSYISAINVVCCVDLKCKSKYEKVEKC